MGLSGGREAVARRGAIPPLAGERAAVASSRSAVAQSHRVEAQARSLPLSRCARPRAWPSIVVADERTLGGGVGAASNASHVRKPALPRSRTSARTPPCRHDDACARASARPPGQAHASEESPTRARPRSRPCAPTHARAARPRGRQCLCRCVRVRMCSRARRPRHHPCPFWRSHARQLAPMRSPAPAHRRQDANF